MRFISCKLFLRGVWLSEWGWNGFPLSISLALTDWLCICPSATLLLVGLAFGWNESETTTPYSFPRAAACPAVDAYYLVVGPSMETRLPRACAAVASTCKPWDGQPCDRETEVKIPFNWMDSVREIFQDELIPDIKKNITFWGYESIRMSTYQWQNTSESGMELFHSNGFKPKGTLMLELKRG